MGADPVGQAVFGTITLGFVGFALLTLRLISRRERPRLDPTLLHWWAAMLSLCGAALAWTFAAPPTLIGVARTYRRFAALLQPAPSAVTQP